MALECLRDALALRAAEELLRWPAFCNVFCKVRSFASCGSRGTDGGVGAASLVGEVEPPLGPENDGFFNMPGMC